MLEMDAFEESTESGEWPETSKRKFWDRVRRKRLRHASPRDSHGPCSKFDLCCTRKSSRSMVRIAWTAVAFVLGSMITLYFNQDQARSAFDMAFGAFSHADGVPLDIEGPEYPSTFLRSVMPIPCHSHNDQMRHIPLHSALGTGCISIEVDVFAASDPSSSELYVAHAQGQVQPNQTVKMLYIEPLLRILELHNRPKDAISYDEYGVGVEQTDQNPDIAPNGIFALSPSTSLTLLLDFKSSSFETYPGLLHAIQPLIRKDWVTYWDPSTQSRIVRPITVVASGFADFDHILHGGVAPVDAPADIKRYIFYDAPLNELVKTGDPDATLLDSADADVANMAKQTAPTTDPSERMYHHYYNPSNSHLASCSLATAIGAISPMLGRPDRFQRQVLREHIRAARARGLLSRYWGGPRWPRGLRDTVWEALQKEGIGLLSVDDLRGVRKGEWGHGASGRWWGWGSNELTIGWMPDYAQGTD